jgi:hypothetical protein
MFDLTDTHCCYCGKAVRKGSRECFIDHKYRERTLCIGCFHNKGIPDGEILYKLRQDEKKEPNT